MTNIYAAPSDFYSLPEDKSLQRKPLYLKFASDYSVTDSGIIINPGALAVQCFTTAEGYKNFPAYMSHWDKVTGGLMAQHDVVHVMFDVSRDANSHDYLTLHGTAGPGADFDLYARCNAQVSLPSGYDYASQSSLQDEAIHLDPAACPNGKWYVAVHNYGTVNGAWKLTLTEHLASRHLILNAAARAGAGVVSADLNRMAAILQTASTYTYGASEGVFFIAGWNLHTTRPADPADGTLGDCIAGQDLCFGPAPFVTGDGMGALTGHAITPGDCSSSTSFCGRNCLGATSGTYPGGRINWGAYGAGWQRRQTGPGASSTWPIENCATSRTWAGVGHELVHFLGGSRTGKARNAATDDEYGTSSNCCGHSIMGNAGDPLMNNVCIQSDHTQLQSGGCSTSVDPATGNLVVSELLTDGSVWQQWAAVGGISPYNPSTTQDNDDYLNWPWQLGVVSIVP
ncbi:MAG: hypothetical protein ACXWVM_32015 [Polyangiales bacterium]